MRLGPYVKLFDVPATQLWIAAVGIGLRSSLETSSDPAVLIALAALVPITLVFFYLMSVNDYFDLAIDMMKGEKSVILSGEVSKRSAQLIIVSMAVGGLALSYFISFGLLLTLLSIFILSTLYSVPPVKYKRFYPLSTAGEVAGAFFLFLAGFSILHALVPLALLASVSTTCVVSAARLRHETRFVEFDRKTGKQTIAVVHGAKATATLSSMLLGTAVAVGFVLLVTRLISPTVLLLTIGLALIPFGLKRLGKIIPVGPLPSIWGFCYFLASLAIPA